MNEKDFNELRGMTLANTALIAALMNHAALTEPVIDSIRASVAGARDQLINSTSAGSEEAIDGFDKTSRPLFAILGQPYPPVLRGRH